MYFIPRNNKFYNYIAHSSLKRCYIATLFCMGAFVLVSVYGVYYPLSAHIELLKAECMVLQKKAQQMEQCEKGSCELTKYIESSKKNIADYGVAGDKREEHCQKRMSFVLESITKAGLALHSYGSCKEKDKEWYVKDSAHFEVVGSINNMMTLLEIIKNARSMITISHVNLTRNADNTFRMGFDVGFVTVKK